MQSQAKPASPPAAASFAGFLAALATPASPAADSRSVWNDNDLADDVATLSYERALRAHARYKSSDLSDYSLTQPYDPGPVRIIEVLPGSPEPAAQSATPQPASDLIADAGTEAAPNLSAAHDRNLKCASITIRLSKEESAQLRKRAAEAGLTVSAYLRSCTFEAESLRALVKDTMAQLRLATSAQEQPASIPVRKGWRYRLAGFWPHPRASQRAIPI